MLKPISLVLLHLPLVWMPLIGPLGGRDTQGSHMPPTCFLSNGSQLFNSTRF